jgi:hypothetical protein
LGTLASAKLDTSNGCQDHTVLPYASSPFVWRALIAHGEPPCNHVHAPGAVASTASHPAFVTIAKRPSCRVGRAELVEMICPTEQEEYFLKQGLTENH